MESPPSRFELLKIALLGLAISFAIFAAFALIGYAAGMRYSRAVSLAKYSRAVVHSLCRPSHSLTGLANVRTALSAYPAIGRRIISLVGAPG
jgi:hypothetical protein